MDPLAVNPDGTAWVSYDAGREADPEELDAPLPFALVAVTFAGRVVVVHNAYRDVWELPGGMIDEGETARQAAVRELAGLVPLDAALAERALAATASGGGMR